MLAAAMGWGDTRSPDSDVAKIVLWGAKTPSVSVGLTPWVGTARSERHKQGIRDPQRSHLLCVKQMLWRPGTSPVSCCTSGRLPPEPHDFTPHLSTLQTGPGFSTPYPSGAKRNLSS